MRLKQGDFEQETVFGEDPAAMAALWESQGASRIHLVDLDGAKTGRPVNIGAVRAITSTVRVPCQLGGGLRDQETIAAWLDQGLEWVVIGTQALREPEWFERMAEEFPGRLVLGLDARSGRVAAEGWLKVSEVRAIDLALRFDRLPLAAVIFTDIARDGMLQGPDVEGTRELAMALKTPVIASGGVGSIDDVEQLAALPILGCIVGRALYEGRFTLAEAVRAGDASPG